MLVYKRAMAQWLTLDNVLITTYLVVLLTLAMYGFHRSMLMYLYYRSRGADPTPQGRFDPTKLPVVTVQLPLFNEMYVVERLLDAVARHRLPARPLEIQVLDDSTDETQEICRAKVDELRAPAGSTSSTSTAPTAPASRPARSRTASRPPRASSS